MASSPPGGGSVRLARKPATLLIPDVLVTRFAAHWEIEVTVEVLPSTRRFDRLANISVYEDAGPELLASRP